VTRRSFNIDEHHGASCVYCFVQVPEVRHGQLKKSGKKRSGLRDDGTFVRRSAGSSRRQHPSRIV